MSNKQLIGLGVVVVAVAVAIGGWLGWRSRPATARVSVPAGTSPSASDVCADHGQQAAGVVTISDGVRWIVLCRSGSGLGATFTPPPDTLVDHPEAVVVVFNGLPEPGIRECPGTGGYEFDLVFGFGDGTAQVVSGDSGACGLVGGRSGGDKVLDVFIRTLAAQRQHVAPARDVTGLCDQPDSLMPMDPQRIVRVYGCTPTGDGLHPQRLTVLPIHLSEAVVASVRRSARVISAQEMNTHGYSEHRGFVVLVSSTGEVYPLARTADEHAYLQQPGSTRGYALWTPPQSIIDSIEHERDH